VEDVWEGSVRELFCETFLTGFDELRDRSLGPGCRDVGVWVEYGGVVLPLGGIAIKTCICKLMYRRAWCGGALPQPSHISRIFMRSRTSASLPFELLRVVPCGYVPLGGWTVVYSLLLGDITIHSRIGNR
jgi:hypothetical protein